MPDRVEPPGPMPEDSNPHIPSAHALLDLLQLADSALPIGAQSHSFGLETLISEGQVEPANLARLLQDYVQEVGRLEAVFCRGAYELGAAWSPAQEGDWTALNRRLAALRPARESRDASAALGRRFLSLACDVTGAETLYAAQTAARRDGAEVHHVAAFGLAGGALGLDKEAAVLAYVQQNVTGLLAATQKLMAVGQYELARLRRALNGPMLDAATAARTQDWRDAPPCCSLQLDLGSMRHPTLGMRLFIS